MQALKDPPTARVVVSIDGPGTVVAVSGRLFASTVAELREVLVAAAETGQGDVVVDLAGVEIIDASGLGVLVGAHRLAMRRGRQLVLRNVPPRIERALVATRLNRVLAVES